MNIADLLDPLQLAQDMKKVESTMLVTIKDKLKSKLNEGHRMVSEELILALRGQGLDWEDLQIIGLTLLMVALAATETDSGRKAVMVGQTPPGAA